MRLMIVKIALLAVIGAPAAKAAVDSNTYFEQLSRYEKRFESEVIGDFLREAKSKGLNREELVEVDHAMTWLMNSVHIEFSEFRSAYESAFLSNSPSKEAIRASRRHQDNVKWAIEISQWHMIEFLHAVSASANHAQVSDSVHRLTENLEALCNSLDKGEKIRIPFRVYLANFVPRTENFGRNLFWFIRRMLFNSPITELIRKIPKESFTAQKSAPEIVPETTATETLFEHLPKNAVLVLAMNHDIGPLDGHGVQTVSEAAGAVRNMVLTSKDAWPHLAFHRNKDPDIFLTETRGFADQLHQRVEQFPDQIVSFSAFPEGAVSTIGAQFPQIANPGVFKTARELSFWLRDRRPVYYIELKSNFAVHTSSGGKIPMRIEVREPERVPDVEVRSGDQWIARKRADFEARMSARDRGFYDLRSASRVDGYRSFRGTPAGTKVSCPALFAKGVDGHRMERR